MAQKGNEKATPSVALEQKKKEEKMGFQPVNLSLAEIQYFVFNGLFFVKSCKTPISRNSDALSSTIMIKRKFKIIKRKRGHVFFLIFWKK